MEKWDQLTLILKENDLQDLLDLIYQNTDRHKDMIEIIKDTTNMWIIKNQIKQNQIAEHIVENINI